jgi:hypothetical protein
LFKHEYLYDRERTLGQLSYVQEASKESDQVIDLYRVEGIAPTYTFPHGKRQCWGKVHLHWWPVRAIPFRVNYGTILGKEGFTMDEVAAVNQMWVLGEAELYKRWIDDIYPEENTKIIKVEYPATDLKSFPIDWDAENCEGSLWSAHAFWHYAFRVCYYIDTKNNKKLN